MAERVTDEMKARYEWLSALPMMSMRQLEERDDLMFLIEPERFDREFQAWGKK